MKRFLFSTGAFPGYLDWGGLLETACSLQDLGHEVLWATSPELAPLLQRVDIEMSPVPIAFKPTPTASSDKEQGQYRALKNFLGMWMDDEQVAASCDAHIRLISAWSPDVVIADPTVLSAALAAEAAGTPLAGCGYPGAILNIPPEPEMEPLVAEFYGWLDKTRKRLGLAEADWRPDPDFLFSAPDLHLVYTTPEWFQHCSSNYSPGAQFVGGKATQPRTPAPVWIEELPTDRPVILIGRTTNYKTMPEAIRIAFEVIKSVGGYGVFGGSLEHRPAFEPLPDYIRWEPWVPYEHAMPRIDAVMHHGGLGTSCLAIHHAVPQVVVPEITDNYIHAGAIARSGAGLAFESTAVNKPTLIRALKEILEKPRYKASAAKLQAQFASLGGTMRAADLLLALADGKLQEARETVVAFSNS
jgi:UDP:flavonoid glycosyltransferase YjiC (YdhE family)